MSKATGLWNAAKEAYRVAKGLLSKNERNAAKAQAKKERGPVKAMFHITKNENVPAIEQQGLVANNPNANVNSAYQPFRSVGVKGGGNWVTDQPTAFPVYGTTVGGKLGNEAARRDALTTFKIEFPVSKLPTTQAVRDPYGHAKLTTADKGWSPFGTWAGNDVNTMAILEDIDPQYLKNIGYVEELNPAIQNPVPNSADRKALELAGLNKADRAAMSYSTGHDTWSGRDPHVTISSDNTKSPARFVEDYLNKHRPIKERMTKSPDALHIGEWGDQFSDARFGELLRLGKGPDLLPPTAERWTLEFKPYTKIGEGPMIGETVFQPGAYSRGMGHLEKPTKAELLDRNFNWDAYNKSIAEGESPYSAALGARPRYRLDWDNIVYDKNLGYIPAVKPSPKINVGKISDGPDWGHVGTSEGTPWSLYDVYKIRHDPKLTAEDRMNFRDDLIRRIYEDGVADGLIDDIKPNATWREIMQAMMKIQTSVK